MANPHHRKKHKEHVKQFRHQHQGGESHAPASRKSGAFFFAVIGALVGLLIAVFAVNSAPVWLAVLIAAGFTGGYFIGKSLEKENTI